MIPLLKMAIPFRQVSIAFLMIAVSGVTAGLWDNRWFVSNELAVMAERVNNLPLDLGSWKGEDLEEDPEMKARLISQGTVHALKTRVYRNTLTGQTVNILLATGRPGPISTHNPMTCIVNKGSMAQASDPTDSKIDIAELGPVEFTQINIRNSAVGGQTEEYSVFWTWHSKNGWIASASPRLSFASYRALTKL